VSLVKAVDRHRQCRLTHSVGQVRQEDKANQLGLQRKECQGVLVHQEGLAHQEDLDHQVAAEIQILEVVLATGCPLGRTESPEEVEVREIQEAVVVEVMTLPAVDTRAGQPVRVVHSAA
jgi:hypothetical protein